MSLSSFGIVINNIRAAMDILHGVRARNGTVLYSGESLNLSSLAYSLTGSTPANIEGFHDSLVNMSREAYSFFRSNRFLTLFGDLSFLDNNVNEEHLAVLSDPFLSKYIFPAGRRLQVNDSKINRILACSVFTPPRSQIDPYLWNGVNTSEMNGYSNGRTEVQPIDYVTIPDGWSRIERSLRLAPAAARANEYYATEDALYFISKRNAVFAALEQINYALPNTVGDLFFNGRIEFVDNICERNVFFDGQPVIANDSHGANPRCTLNYTEGDVTTNIPIGTRNRFNIPLTGAITVTVNAVANAATCFIIRMKGKFYLNREGARNLITGGSYNVASPESGDIDTSNFAIRMNELNRDVHGGGIRATLDRVFTELMNHLVNSNRNLLLAPYNWNYVSRGHFYDLGAFNTAFFNSDYARSGLTDATIRLIMELGRKVIFIMVFFMSFYTPA